MAVFVLRVLPVFVLVLWGLLLPLQLLVLYSGPAYGYDTVAAVQQRLAELGYYRGVIDGIMGPQTRAAISAYEATHNLVVDGSISGPLLARMGLS